MKKYRVIKRIDEIQNSETYVVQKHKRGLLRGRYWSDMFTDMKFSPGPRYEYKEEEKAKIM